MMDRKALEARLRAEDVSPDAFSIGVDRDETYSVIPDAPGEFRVYYSERGHGRDERVHSDEASALEDLLVRLLDDPTTRIAYRNAHRWPG
jgi:hypothetical protein